MTTELMNLLSAETVQAVCDDMGWTLEDFENEATCVQTAETIEDFDRSRNEHWSEAGRRDAGEYAGVNGVLYTGFQLTKGQPRQEMLVLDLGEQRLVVC